MCIASYACVSKAPMMIFGGTAIMGQVIEGPWIRRDVLELVSQIEQELRRMITVLEKSREGHATQTAPNRQSHSHRAKERTPADVA